MVKGQDEEENILKKREKELMNITLATLASLAAFYNKDYANDDENKSENEDMNENKNENENKPVNHSVDRPLVMIK
jgi:hypothetical protein